MTFLVSCLFGSCTTLFIKSDWSFQKSVQKGFPLFNHLHISLFNFFFPYKYFKYIALYSSVCLRLNLYRLLVPSAAILGLFKFLVTHWKTHRSIKMQGSLLKYGKATLRWTFLIDRTFFAILALGRRSSIGHAVLHAPCPCRAASVPKKNVHTNAATKKWNTIRTLGDRTNFSLAHLAITRALARSLASSLRLISPSTSFNGRATATSSFMYFCIPVGYWLNCLVPNWFQVSFRIVHIDWLSPRLATGVQESWLCISAPLLFGLLLSKYYCIVLTWNWFGAW